MRPHLFSDRGCPWAHRVLALLGHLGVEHESSAARVGELPPGLLALSPSGRIPLLVHGDLVIGESRVMIEHIAEAYDFENAYPRDLVQRTRHREAMALIDLVVIPRALSGRGEVDDPRLAECLDVLESLAVTTPPEPSLLAFSVAPFWLRLPWWLPDGPATRAIRLRPRLTAWLDAVTALGAVMRCAPDRVSNTADFARVALATSS